MSSAVDTYTYQGTITNGKWVCTNHTRVADAAVDATCTTTGLTEGEHCTACGTVTVAQQTIPVLGHSWKDATCTAPKTCAVCGATEGTALAHTPGTAATCTTAQTCTVCGTELAPARGHSFGANDLCVNGCGLVAYKVDEDGTTSILSKGSTDYKVFSLKVSDWQVLRYDNGDTYVGFRATLKGDILDDVTAVGFAINGDVSKPAPHEWVEEADDTYTYTCLLKTTENEHTVQGVIDFQNVRYTSLSVRIYANDGTVYEPEKTGTA